ncbi:lactonase family protein [Candidatus Sulfidibacterium hydrothermale]|uniref:lactonase family protein n=1 Tax=Candidatus Sulfidibacterium hydrothermale TaxID=2875962 RepID=UPI001F0B3842|nr:lactonase family protein [Candidatus Sulfidibacterium hydrothermale]UBM63081.1 lactonase family protein [Candidatus Sulfidibacterium hydrothermale]
MKTIYAVFAGFLLLLPGFLKAQKNNTENRSYVFYLGTYTQGSSRGIYKYRLTEDGILHPEGLQAKTSNPSYLTFGDGERFLLAVNENNPGTVSSFAVYADTLAFLGQSRSGGDAPCYVSVSPSGWVLTANYGSGTVGLLKLKANGKLSPLLFTQKHFSALRTPHAHAAKFIPGTNQVVATDLGTDQLWFSQLDPVKKRLIAGSPATLALSKGSGPRHFVFYRGNKSLFVVGEEGNSVTLVKKESDGHWKPVRTWATLPKDFHGKSYAADIHFSPDYRFLYVSNRGSNTLVVFRVTDNGNVLQPVAWEPVRGNWPRNFALTPDGKYLVVANQKSNNLVVFRRDAVTGKLKFVSETQAGSPVCVLFCSQNGKPDKP